MTTPKKVAPKKVAPKAAAAKKAAAVAKKKTVGLYCFEGASGLAPGKKTPKPKKS